MFKFSSVTTIFLKIFCGLFYLLFFTMATEGSRIAKANNKFGIDLFKILAKEDNNLLISPLSAHVVLSMAYQGAAGDTSKNMGSIFNLPSPEETADEYHTVVNALNKVESVTLKVANKIYIMQKFKLLPEFQKIIQTKYLSEADEINFAENINSAKVINNWVEDKTNRKITDLIKPEMLDGSTRLVLLNAVYFKGNWAKKFDSSQTSRKPFYLLNGEEIFVDMMHLKDKFHYGEDDTLNCKILELPYQGNELSMVIFLPNERNGITQLQDKLSNIEIDNVLRQMRLVTVNVQLPKFKIESTLPLKETLDKMGAGHMFTDQANFSKMATEPLKVSDVIQKTFIEVNEEGAEAAAATAMLMKQCALIISRIPDPEFLADHPFIFSLIYKENKNMLFVGTLRKPIV